MHTRYIPYNFLAVNFLSIIITNFNMFTESEGFGELAIFIVVDGWEP